MTIFDDLIIGDRFMFMGNMWTKVKPLVARKHEYPGLNANGDSVCSFSGAEEVEFLEPWLPNEITDRERLDFLDSLTGNGSGKIILRDSLTGRGWRLHETSKDHSYPTVREAIDDGIKNGVKPE